VLLRGFSGHAQDDRKLLIIKWKLHGAAPPQDGWEVYRRFIDRDWPPANQERVMTKEKQGGCPWARPAPHGTRTLLQDAPTRNDSEIARNRREHRNRRNRHNSCVCTLKDWALRQAMADAADATQTSTAKIDDPLALSRGVSPCAGPHALGSFVPRLTKQILAGEFFSAHASG
jgi:hypothetical protein